MHKSTLYILFLSLVGRLYAGEQSITVTPSTLADWVVTGTDRTALEQEAGLSVPAGAQLSRYFDADRLVVSIKANAYFGTNSEDFTVVENGPAALVLSRNGAEGRLVLVLGNAAPISLPFSISLDARGSGVGPVELQLAYDRVAGTVTVNGSDQKIRYDSEASTSPIEAVISAGAHDPLALDILAVSTFKSDSAAGTTGTTTGKKHKADGTSEDGTSAKRKTVPWNNLMPPAGSGQDFSTKGVTLSSPPSGLQIFTPSSFRKSRLNTIRAAVLKTSDNLTNAK